MNAPRLKNWSERRQVLAIMLMAGTSIFLLWFFLLTPLSNRRRRLEREIEEMQSQLASKNFLMGESALQQTLDMEIALDRRLKAEWEAVSERLSVFTNQHDLAEAQVGKIDFKVRLFDVRMRLQRKSSKMNIELPYNLGMAAEVDSNEDARKLMLQLMTVERLVDVMLDLKIDEMRRVEPLPPVLHRDVAKGEVYLEEYPVRVDFFATLDNLYDFHRASLAQGMVFAARHLRVESAAPVKADVLLVKAVVSSLLFAKRPDQVFEPPVARGARVLPMGH